MRILMLIPTYPFPTDTGAKRRNRAFIEAYAQKHEVTLVSLCQQTAVRVQNPNWEEHCVDWHEEPRPVTSLKAVLFNRSYLEQKFRHQKIFEIVDEWVGKRPFDLIHIGFVSMAPYLRQTDTIDANTHLLLDQHNVDDAVRKSYVQNSRNLLHRLYSLVDMLKARKLQKKWFPQFHTILSVAPEDIALTRPYMQSEQQILLAPNGVDTDYFTPVPAWEIDDVPKLVFGGSLDVSMNEDAVQFFVAEIWPRVQQRLPKVELYIVGRNPSLAVNELAKQENIFVKGNVPDIRYYFKRASVFIIPLRLGGGTKLKTVEGLAMALPIVTTSVGAQGLDVVSGEHLLIADKPEQFADDVCRLIEDRVLAKRLGQNGRLLIEKKYSWDKIVGDVEDYLLRLK